MCGIVGINWDDKTIIQKMMKSLAHRGPDQFGHYVNKGISLGHQRLSIVDLSEKGKQPIYNEEGDICIVFNGEIYNYQKIKNELKNHKFKSDTDTEVLVHAYEEWGLNAIERLNGMFAFALYDSKNKTLVLARDRVGIKPLYYYWKAGKFVFASEIKAIFEAGVPRKLRMDAIGDVLQYGFTPSPETMWQDIYKLPSGHYAILNGKNFEIRQYWDITFNSGGGNLDYYTASFRAMFKQSVKQQLMSDVPYGAYLSGGLDSSSIVAYMSQQVDKPVKTFTVGFDSSDVIDETKYASMVVKHFNTEHQEVIVNSDQVIKALPTIAYHLDEPIANAASIPLYYMSKEAKKKVTVVLTGNGGDELFGGYRQHKLISLAKKYSYLKGIGSIFKKQELFPSKYSRYAKFASEFMPLADNPSKAYSKLMYKTFDDNAVKELGVPHISADQRIAPFFSNSDNVVNQLIKLDMKFLLAENYLMVDDKINMINSVESRVPYLDNLMIGFASNLPVNYKVHGLTGKYIVRRAMRGILPSVIINRNKYGFTPPVKKWSETVLQKHCNNMFDDTALIKSLGVSKDKISNILNKNNPEFHNRIFPLTMLGEWAKRYLI